jgi:DNA gyrase subunit A
MGRATQGVRLINIKGNDAIASIAKTPREEDEEIDLEAMEGVQGDVDSPTNGEDSTTDNTPETPIED